VSTEHRLDRLEDAVGALRAGIDPLEVKGLARVEFKKRQALREANVKAIKTASALRERLRSGSITTAQMLQLELCIGAVVLLSRHEVECRRGVWHLLPVVSSQEPIRDKIQRLAVLA
jgi:hypothetical protein